MFVSKVTQIYIYLYLFFFKLFSHLDHFRVLSSLCGTVGPCWLSVSNVAVVHVHLTLPATPPITEPFFLLTQSLLVRHGRISLQQPILLLFCFPLLFSSCFSSSFLSDSYDQKSCSHFSQLKSKRAVITSTTKPSFQPLPVFLPIWLLSFPAKSMGRIMSMKVPTSHLSPVIGYPSLT